MNGMKRGFFFPNLSSESLVSAFAEQKLDDGVVILLSSHIQWCEAILRLCVHRRPSLNQ